MSQLTKVTLSTQASALQIRDRNTEKFTIPAYLILLILIDKVINHHLRVLAIQKKISQLTAARMVETAWKMTRDIVPLLRSSCGVGGSFK